VNSKLIFIITGLSDAVLVVYKTRTIFLQHTRFCAHRVAYHGCVTTNRIALCGLFLLTAGHIAAQPPAIASGGIVNGATFSSGPVAPGSIASIFGSNLAGSLATASTVPLSTALADVNVTINGQPAPLYFVSPDQAGKPGTGQINIQIPYDVLPAGTSSGSVNVVVTRTTAGASQPAAVQIAALAPGILQASGHAIAINSDGTLAAAPSSIPGLTTHAATAGDVLIIYATGLGAVTPSVANGANAQDQLRRTNVTPVILIGGIQAEVQFSGLTPQFTGVNQVNVKVPSGVAAGDSVPLQIQEGSITTSNQVTIAIR
jgi:uncharacterized protein (TIGR03437 family)